MCLAAAPDHSTPIPAGAEISRCDLSAHICKGRGDFISNGNFQAVEVSAGVFGLFWDG